MSVVVIHDYSDDDCGYMIIGVFDDVQAAEDGIFAHHTVKRFYGPNKAPRTYREYACGFCTMYSEVDGTWQVVDKAIDAREPAHQPTPVEVRRAP